LDSICSQGEGMRAFQQKSEFWKCVPTVMCSRTVLPDSPDKIGGDINDCGFFILEHGNMQKNVTP
jgi:hypothetical protein